MMTPVETPLFNLFEPLIQEIEQGHERGIAIKGPRGWGKTTLLGRLAENASGSLGAWEVIPGWDEKKALSMLKRLLKEKEDLDKVYIDDLDRLLGEPGSDHASEESLKLVEEVMSRVFDNNGRVFCTTTTDLDKFWASTPETLSRLLQALNDQDYDLSSYLLEPKEIEDRFLSEWANATEEDAVQRIWGQEYLVGDPASWWAASTDLSGVHPSLLGPCLDVGLRSIHRAQAGRPGSQVPADLVRRVLRKQLDRHQVQPLLRRLSYFLSGRRGDDQALALLDKVAHDPHGKLHWSTDGQVEGSAEARLEESGLLTIAEELGEYEIPGAFLREKIGEALIKVSVRRQEGAALVEIGGVKTLVPQSALPVVNQLLNADGSAVDADALEKRLKQSKSTIRSTIQRLNARVQKEAGLSERDDLIENRWGEGYLLRRERILVRL